MCVWCSFVVIRANIFELSSFMFVFKKHELILQYYTESYEVHIYMKFPKERCQSIYF